MNKKYIAAATLAALIGGGVYFQESRPPTEQKKVSSTAEQTHIVGYIDLQKIQAKHPDGEKLKDLCGREVRLRLELNEAMKPVETVKPPEVDEKPFEDSAWQKNAQEVIGQLAEIQRRRKNAAEDYRKETEAEHIRRRDEIRDKYLNEVLNIKLKLQNADNLMLTLPQIAELEDRLDQLEAARNQDQLNLLNEWLAEIEAHADAAVAADRQRLRSEAGATLEAEKLAAQQKQEEVQKRNKDLMEQTAKEIESRQKRRQELLAELTEVTKERSDLEREILKSITDEAEKLGAIYKADMILVKRDPADSEKFLPYEIEMNFELKSPTSPGTPIFPGVNSKDLTDDLIKNLGE